MKTKFYHCVDRSLLDSIVKFEGNYYSDQGIFIDVIGIINLNVPTSELSVPEERLSDFLFNVLFIDENRVKDFASVDEIFPETPSRQFFIN